MILEKQTETVVMEEGEVQLSTNMEIDADSHIFLMRMLSKFYSDNIGSPIRETASNALDSHRQMGSTDPIVVSLIKGKDGNYEFSVEDFGMGMDDVVVETVIKKYGKSTKRNSANQLGAFGLGFKSPLAYSSSFVFIGRKDGIERKWMMYESDDESNKIDLLHEGPTTERNGVKIVMSVKWVDKTSFVHKIQEQLAYFEHVFFNVEGISNDFIITRHQDFQWSSLYSGGTMHICLDNVYYPIDWSKMGIPAINFPVALRFGLADGLFPIPNREQLKYTPEAKKIILDKITLVADYFVKQYNDTVKDCEDIHSLFAYYNTGERFVQGLGTQKWNIGPLKSYTKLKYLEPKLKGIVKLDMKRVYHMKDYLVKEWEKAYEHKQSWRGKKSRIMSLKNKWYRDMSLNDLTNNVLYSYTEWANKQKKDYIRDVLNTKSAYFITKSKAFTLKGKPKTGISRDVTSYMDILNLKSYPKSDWRDMIKEFQGLQTTLFKDVIDLDKVNVPKQWIEDQKLQRVKVMVQKGTNIRRVKLVGEVTGRIAKNLERYVSGKNCKFESIVIQLKDLYKDKKITIYCENTEENEDVIQKWFSVVRPTNIQFVTFSERELKKLKQLDVHNWVKMEEFVKGNNKSFKRIATAYLIKKLQDEYTSVFDKTQIIGKISTDLSKKMNDLTEYKNKWYVRGDEKLYEAILDVAESKDLFDKTIHHIYKEVKFVLSKLPFAIPICKNISTYSMDEPVIQAMRDLFKYHKTKIDWQHYGLKLNEAPVETLKEEVLEELV